MAAEAARIDEWLAPVEQALLAKCNNEIPLFDSFKQLLRETGSLIAGGCILNAIQPFPKGKWDMLKASNDIDIYVPTKQIPIFVRSVTRIFNSHRVRQITASLYCKSFLRKNGIRKIYTFNTKFTKDKHLYIDVMSVRNKRTPLAVVNNFDLTFCQVWYNGEHVFASHPDHIREKKGFMSAEYIPTFLAGNRFLVRRTQKYIDRGFTILPDPASPGLADLFQKIPEQIAFSRKRNELDETQMKHWINHTLLNIAKNPILNTLRSFYNPDITYPIIPNFQPNEINDYIFTKNLLNGLDGRDKYFTREYRGGFIPVSYRFFEQIEDQDGYDSDDFNNELIEEDIISKCYHQSNDDLVFELQNGKRVPNPSNELKYYRTLTNILIHSLGVNQEGEYDIEIPTLRIYIDLLKRKGSETLEKVMKYAAAMKQFMTRNGVDFMGDEGQVFDIHNHPLEGAITQDSLEAYCETHIADIDKTEVPCYWQPEPGDSPKNCKHKLRLQEVRAIVSEEFFERYNKPAPIKSGLNQIIPAYDIIFSNSKTPDPIGFGDIYGKTVCPFCLQLENRDEGCAYMTHSNPKRLGNKHTPFCQENFVTPLLEKYRQRARELFPDLSDEIIHIEFCVECGRPCVNHQHFDLESPAGLAPTPMKPDPLNPALMVHDYGKCAGGGRPELYARILAIREIYNMSELSKPSVERATAAEAAEHAARDPDYLARGRAIFEKSEDERKWNVNVLSSKHYNNNAYNNDSKEDDDMPVGGAGAGTGAGAGAGANQAGGKRRHKTYKKRKNTNKKSRKNVI